MLGLSALVLTNSIPASAQGFFSRLFGNSADLKLTIAPLSQGAKSAVTIDILAKQAISPKRVYVQLRCLEKVEIEKYRVPADPEQGDQEAREINVSKSEIVDSKEYTLVEFQQYTKNSKAQVKGEIEVPATFPISAKGKFFKVRCEVRAGLDLKGNAPNSRWQDVVIKQK